MKYIRMRFYIPIILIWTSLFLTNCSTGNSSNDTTENKKYTTDPHYFKHEEESLNSEENVISKTDNKALNIRTIHVFVALCDNENQGIVPVPERIGNGQDPKHNLYWGAGYGVKNFFNKKTADWELVETIFKPSPVILERCMFKHKDSNIYLLADAYDGAEIKQATIDLLKASAGDHDIVLSIDSMKIGFGGHSDLVAYTGHDGLMDFYLDDYPVKKDSNKREVIILACYSKDYFSEAIKSTGAFPLLWSTHLMAPEAYTLKDAIDGWILNETGEEVRSRAAVAYNRYQKCGIRGARNLLVSGW